MKKRRKLLLFRNIIFCVFLALAIFVLGQGVFAWTDSGASFQNVDGCNTLNTTNAIYNLTIDPLYTSPGSSACFTINASNISLECNGHSILNRTVEGIKTGIAIGLETPIQNISLKNCIIDMNITCYYAPSDYDTGILISNSASNVLISNITINNTCVALIVNNNSDVWVYNSSITNTGGEYLLTTGPNSNASFFNSYFSGALDTLGSGLIVIRDFALAGNKSWLSFYNSTGVNISSVCEWAPLCVAGSFSNWSLSKYWYVDWYVNNTRGAALSGVNISTYNLSALLNPVNVPTSHLWNTTTISTGYIAQQYLREVFNNGTNDGSEYTLYYDGNYSVNATNLFGYENKSVPINMSESPNNKNKFFTLSDITPPVSNLISPTDYQNLSSQTVIFNCSQTDGIYLKNSTLYGNWTGSWVANETVDISGTSNYTTFTKVISDGLYKWNCYVCDYDSNCVLNSTNWTFTVDTTYPLINFGNNVEVNGTNVSRNWIYVNVTITESHFKNLTFYLYNSTSSSPHNLTSYTSTQRTINWTGLSDGYYWYNATSCDYSGNCNSTRTFTITLDTAPPVISIISPLNRTYTIPSLNFNVSLNKVGNWCGYSLDGAADKTMTANSSSTGFNATNSSMIEGSHSILFTCNDSLGNMNYTDTLYFSIDTCNSSSRYYNNSDCNYRGDRSFTASIDSSTQYYWLDMPNSFNSSKTYPMIIFLHGYTGNRTDYIGSEANLSYFRTLARAQGWIVVAPDYRGNSFMNSTARSDISDIIRDMNSSFSINSSRIHMIGMSMGGGATLTYAKHNPFVIASICDMSGITNFTQFYNETILNITQFAIDIGLLPTPYENFRQVLNASFGGTPQEVPEVYNNYSALGYESLFSDLPIMILHQKNDSAINVTQSRNFNASLVASGNIVNYTEADICINEVYCHGYEVMSGKQQAILSFFGNYTLRDRTAPIISLISPGNSTTYSSSNNVEFYYNVTDVSSTITNCSLIIDGSLDQTILNPDKGISNKITYSMVNGNYNWSVNCIDSWNNQGHSLTNLLIVAYSSSSQAASSPSSSGGTPPYWASTYVLNDNQFTSGFTQELEIKNRFKFDIGSSEHSVGVVGLTPTTATINVSSTPQQATFYIGDEKKFDVTNDNYYDVYIKLNSINNGKANITIKSIHELMPTTSANKENETNENKKEQGVINLNGNYSKHIAKIVFAIILIIVFLAIIILLFRKIKEHRIRRRIRIKHV
jgi:esterase/lipase